MIYKNEIKVSLLFLDLLAYMVAQFHSTTTKHIIIIEKIPPQITENNNTFQKFSKKQLNHEVYNLKQIHKTWN